MGRKDYLHHHLHFKHAQRAGDVAAGEHHLQEQTGLDLPALVLVDVDHEQPHADVPGQGDRHHRVLHDAREDALTESRVRSQLKQTGLELGGLAVP